MSLARNLSKFKPSSSGLVETADIADDAVSTDQIANNAVINTSGAVTTTGAFTSVGIDDNADANAITIDSSELVGIGTTTPSSYNQNGNGLVVNKASVDGNTSGISIVSGTSATGNIYFSDATGNSLSGGAIEYSHSSNRMNVYVNDANRLQILDGGDVNVKTGNLVIGTAGKGISFAADGNAPDMTNELLDDYEEGECSLTMGGLTNISTSAANIQANNTYSGGQAHYVKVGTLCYVQAYFFSQATSTQAAGDLVIQGLPFTAAGNGGNFTSQSYNLTLPAGVNGQQVAIFQAAGGTQLNGQLTRSGATWASVQASVMPNGSAIYFRIAGTYRTA